MRKHDFGTTQLFLDEDAIDVFFARPHDEIKNLVKSRWGGRWDGERRCFKIRMRFVKGDSQEDIVAAIESELYANAPPVWRSMVEKFGGIVCASKRYEIKIGAGGLRVMLPGGHPLHWHIAKMTGDKHRSDTWELPAKSLKGSDMRMILERCVKEDRNVFIDEVEPYENRTITGTAMLDKRLADSFGLFPGKIVFANYSFLKIADPQVVNQEVVRRQVRAWPFIVNTRVDTPEPSYTDLAPGVGITLQLAYPPAEIGYREVKRWVGLPEEERPPSLDDPHTVDKWRFRNG